MAISHKKKNEKKQRKQQKRKRIVSQKLLGSTVPLSDSPIYKCLVHKKIWEVGIGVVCIVRRTSPGYLYLGNYLIDTWCLGLKDAFVRKISQEELNRFMSEQPLEQKEPEYAKALIMASIDYGHTNGFSPKIDHKSSKFIDKIPYNPKNYHFEFGCNGKPLYIPGPHDNEILSHMVK